MTLFVTSETQATRHGVYGIERTPPSVIQAAGTGTVAIVEQFPWGPVGSVYQTIDINDFLSTFAPAGMTRTGAGVMSVLGKAWPTLKIVRVDGASSVIASCAVPKSGPTTCIVLHAKYPGAAGNSITATVTDATDADDNHFNLAVSVTSASGTTTDTLENLNYSGTGSDSTPDFSSMYLLGNITVTAAGVVTRGTYSFISGANGTVTAPSYVGTAGAGDAGIALLEGDADVDFVITGDPGNSLRPDVNAGLLAHGSLMTDRQTFINGDSGMSLSDALTDIATYSGVSQYTDYFDNWAYQNDDVTGASHLVAPAVFAASLAANLSPSTSYSWKSSEAKRYLTSIVQLEANRGDAAHTIELAGANSFQKETKGGFSIESAVNTLAPANPAKKKSKRTRMAIYIAKSIKDSIRESTDSPNVPFNQQDEVHAVSVFLDGLVNNAKVDPNHLPHLIAAGIGDLGTFNSQADLDAGNFTIPIEAQTSSDQERIYLSLEIGETVSVDTSNV